MTTAAMPIEEIVDISLYPVTDLTSPAAETLINELHTQLSEQLYCVLPDFVSSNALAAMAAEARSLQDQAYHNNALRNCYLHQQQDPDFPGNHARNLQDRSSTRMLAYDQIAEHSALKILYQHSGVRSLVAGIVGQGPLYENEDPYQPANYVCYQDGDESSWHFDADNSFTMTLMIQPAQTGGEFQMSPHTRTEDEPNYHHVADVLNGRRDDTILSVGREPGALCIFKGCNSLHRVTPVHGATLRIMGVFVYEFSAGISGDPRVNATIYGPRTQA